MWVGWSPKRVRYFSTEAQSQTPKLVTGFQAHSQPLAPFLAHPATTQLQASSTCGFVIVASIQLREPWRPYLKAEGSPAR